jgi:hypothetical protein
MERKIKRVATGCGLAFVLLLGAAIVLIVLLGTAIETGMVPDTAARPVGKIPARQLRQLREMGVTREGEIVLFFYSAAFLDIRGDGNLFTDQRVISYYDSDGTPEISDATYDEIAEIEFEPNEAWLEDSTITVTKHDGTWFVLYVGNDANGDELFYDKLMEEWAKHRTIEMAEEQPDVKPPETEKLGNEELEAKESETDGAEAVEL